MWCRCTSGGAYVASFDNTSEKAIATVMVLFSGVLWSQVHTSTRTHTHAHTQLIGVLCIHTYASTCIHIRIRIHICIHIRTHPSAYIRTHPIRIHLHTQLIGVLCAVASNLSPTKQAFRKDLTELNTFMTNHSLDPRTCLRLREYDACIHTCRRTCIRNAHAYTCIHMHTHIHTHMHSYTHAHTLPRPEDSMCGIRTCIHTCIRTCTYTCIYTYCTLQVPTREPAHEECGFSEAHPSTALSWATQ